MSRRHPPSLAAGRRGLAALLVLVLAACGSGDPPGTKLDGKGTDLFPRRDGYSPPPGCSSASCSGCCLGKDCLSGTGTSACGYGGNTCQVCKSGEACVGGLCVPPKCDSASCASGCCDTVTGCKSGKANDACGTTGDACVACQGSDLCVAGKCQPPGPAMVKITLASAVITGSAWYVCGFAELSDCDLYVILKVGGAQAQSTTKWNTQQPQWSEYLLTVLETEILKGMSAEVRDDDSPLGSVQVGSCELKPTAAALAAGKITQDCGDAKQLTFTFQKI